MTAPKPKPLGTSVEVPEGATVVRPDLSEITVTGGVYVLDAIGEHVVDGKQLHVTLDADPEQTKA